MPDEDSENRGGKEKTVDLSPDKQIYRSAAVDVSPVDAIEELVDNALDNWMRTSQRVDNISINIEADDGYTRVTDNTGGLSRDRIKHLFALGKTFQHEVDGAIGAYGIGAKKAIVRLGDDRIVKSRARDADRGYGFTVDEEWLNSDDWSVTIEDFKDLAEGETELVMETNETVWDDQTLDQLRAQLGETYKLFLNGSIPDAGNVDLKLNGSPVQPAADPDWSFTPFDGLHPRRYENIKLYPKSIDSPVQMDVTVGLMRQGDEDSSGTTIYCQDRLVTDNEHGEVGGYGKAGRHRIGNWSHHNNRLMVIVELTTQGDGSDLPWDAQKSTIDPHHAVSRSMYHWLSRIVTPYFDANTGRVKKAFVHPYDADSEYAANSGGIEVLNYKDQQNVTHKPDDDLNEITRVKRLAESYADRGFKYYGDIPEEYQPAFDAHFENNYNPDDHDGTPIEDVPVRDSLSEEEQLDLESQEEQLANLVSAVRGAGKSKKEALMQEGFMSLEDIADASNNELTTVSGVGRALANRLRAEAESRLQESSDDTDDADSQETNAVDDDGAVSNETDSADDTDADTNDDDVSDDIEKDGIEEGRSELSDPDQSSDDTSDTADVSGQAGTNRSPDQTDLSTGDGTGDGIGEQPKLFEATEDGKVRVPVEFDREEYDQLRETLSIDEDDPEVFGETVREKLLQIYAQAASQ